MLQCLVFSAIFATRSDTKPSYFHCPKIRAVFGNFKLHIYPNNNFNEIHRNQATLVMFQVAIFVKIKADRFNTVISGSVNKILFSEIVILLFKNSLSKILYFYGFRKGLVYESKI